MGLFEKLVNLGSTGIVFLVLGIVAGLIYIIYVMISKSKRKVDADIDTDKFASMLVKLNELRNIMSRFVQFFQKDEDMSRDISKKLDDLTISMRELNTKVEDMKQHSMQSSSELKALITIVDRVISKVMDITMDLKTLVTKLSE